MNILLYHPQKDISEMIAFCLESQRGLSVNQATTFQEAIYLLLGDWAVDLIITNQQSETDKLFKYLLSANSNIPFIIVGSDSQEKLDTYPDIKVLGQLRQTEIPDKLLRIIDKNFNDILKFSMNEDYCRISPELLVRVVPLRGDVYIKLSSIKFIKLFKSGSKFTTEDLERFLITKKVSYLYIKKEDCREFVQKFKEDLTGLVNKAKEDDPVLLETVADVQVLIQDLSNRLGFTKEIQELARSNIQLTIKAIGASPKLLKVIASSPLKDKNYISSHSVILAGVSCSIAALMQWPSDTTFQKLVLASLFHDFVFQDPALAKISTKDELEFKSDFLTKEQINSVKDHPIKCGDIIKSLTEIPGDVDFLVVQHHERPNGSGFPRGLRADQIPPLSALFIIAHDIIDRIAKDGDKFDFKSFLKQMESEYKSGSFKKIWKVLMDQHIEKSGSTSGQSAA